MSITTKRILTFPQLFTTTLFFFTLAFLLCYNYPTNSKKHLETTRSLKHFMIRHEGLYTLFGTKPMCLFELTDGRLTSKQKQDRYQKLSILKKITHSKEEVDLCLNSSKQWDNWMKQWDKIHSSKYIFYKRWGFGFFLNIAETTWVLHKYYNQFRKVVNQDFNPIEEAKSFSNPNSDFWEKIGPPNNNHALWGLLFGYGEKNSYLFETGIKCSLPIEEFPKDFKSINLSIQALSVPSFKTFSMSDETVDYYKNQRKKILKTLKGKNFTKEVLFLLEEKGF